RFVAGAGEDRDAQFGIGLERVPDLVQLIGRGAMERVANVGAIDGDDQQMVIVLDAAEFHDVLSPAILPYSTTKGDSSWRSVCPPTSGRSSTSRISPISPRCCRTARPNPRPSGSVSRTTISSSPPM